MTTTVTGAFISGYAHARYAARGTHRLHPLSVRCYRAAHAHRAAPPGHDVEPDPSTTARYDALYGVYLKMYPALRDLFGDLAAVP